MDLNAGQAVPKRVLTGGGALWLGEQLQLLRCHHFAFTKPRKQPWPSVRVLAWVLEATDCVVVRGAPSTRPSVRRSLCLSVRRQQHQYQLQQQEEEAQSVSQEVPTHPLAIDGATDL